MESSQRGRFWGFVIAILGIMAATFPALARHTNLGLEFKGGYEIVYQAKPVSGGALDHASLVKAADRLAEVANKQGVDEPLVNILGTDQIRVELAGVKAGDPVVADLHKVTGLPVSLVEKYSETVGGVLGASDLHDTILAGLIALGAIFSFLVLAYRGFALLHLEIDITFIAAMLIVIGYALNEAVVVFDRIRERLRDAGQPSVELVNTSIHQVLKRSLYTVLTVIIGAVSLFAFGAEPLQMFSLAIFLGLAWGTFASLFIAPRLWLTLARSGRHVEVMVCADKETR